MSTWQVQGTDGPGSIYEVLFRTRFVTVAQKSCNDGQVRIRLQIADLPEGKTLTMSDLLEKVGPATKMPAPFEVRSPQHASATVAQADARAALHRITDWAVSLQTAWPHIQ